MKYKGYNGSSEYSDEDKMYYGKILGIQDTITYEAMNASSIKSAFKDAVDDYLNYCARLDREPDVPKR